MIDRLSRRRVKSGAFRGVAARPRLEGLEDRLLMYATTGDKFSYATRITLSVMPDGTQLGGVTSNLMATLDGKFGAQAWEPAFLAASAWWENYANVNLVWIGDDGSPFGSGNYQQGDPNKGDIRIGGFAQDLNTLAFTILPPPANGDSGSGDIFFNTSEAWGMNSGLDLETIAIHEIGHALGLGHSADQYASMYYAFNGIKQTPDSDDIAGIQAVWGARPEDGLAQGWANYLGSSYAANITPFMDTNNDQITLSGLDIAQDGESYWFKVTTPSNASSHLSIAVQSANLSELSPKVQLYDSNVHGLLQAAASPNSYGAVIGLTYTSATPNTVYYIRVMGSNGNQTGAGSYALLVNMGNAAQPMVSPPVVQVGVQASQGGGGTNEVLGGVIGGANNALNTPVDMPSTVVFPTATAQADFLTINGVDPGVYVVAPARSSRPVASVPTAPISTTILPAAVATSAPTSTTIEIRHLVEVPRPSAGLKVAHPSGPASSIRRPAQGQPKVVKLGE